MVVRECGSSKFEGGTDRARFVCQGLGPPQKTGGSDQGEREERVIPSGCVESWDICLRGQQTLSAKEDSGKTANQEPWTEVEDGEREERNGASRERYGIETTLVRVRNQRSLPGTAQHHVRVQ